MTASVKVTNNETSENSTIAAGNETSTVGSSFPTPRVFPSSQPFTASNVLPNNTIATEGENASFVTANETTTIAPTTPLVREQDNATEPELRNGSATGIAENITVTTPTAENEVNATVGTTLSPDINTTTENITLSSEVSNVTSSTSGSELVNATTPEVGNFSLSANETKFAIFNLTASEGFLLLSKTGHRNLSWMRETEDGVTEIASGEGSGFWEPDLGNDTSSGDSNLNRTSHVNRTATIAPLTLTNATIVIVGEDGRGRRNVLSPLLDATNELIKREDDKKNHQDGNARRLRDEPYERLPDIETDVSQLMWVLEPEEGPVRGKRHLIPCA